MIVPTPYVIGGIGLLNVLLGLPLWWRMVPMNPVYGMRTPEAFRSERHWYAINAYGGRLLALYGVALLLLSLVYGAWAPPPTSAWTPLLIAAPLLGLIPLLRGVVRFGRAFE